MSVASLTDFEIGIVSRGGERALSTAIDSLGHAQVIEQSHIVELAVIAIHLWYFLLELSEVTFRKAAHDIQFSDASLFLGKGQLQDHLDAFLLGVTDKAARVDDHDLSAGIIAVMVAHETMRLKLSHEPLAVHQIFGAA